MTPSRTRWLPGPPVKPPTRAGASAQQLPSRCNVLWSTQSPSALHPLHHVWLASRSARPAGVEAADPPSPRRSLVVRELVVVAAGEGLERDPGGVLLEEDRGAGGSSDLDLAGATNHAF